MLDSTLHIFYQLLSGFNANRRHPPSGTHAPRQTISCNCIVCVLLFRCSPGCRRCPSCSASTLLSSITASMRPRTEPGMEVPSHLPWSNRTYAHNRLIPSKPCPPKPKVSSCTSLSWLGRRWHPHHLKLTDSLHVSCPYGPFPPT